LVFNQKNSELTMPGAMRSLLNRNALRGLYNNGGEHSFLLNASFFSSIDPPFNCIGDNFATGINEGGEIVGYASVCGNANGYSRQGPALAFPVPSDKAHCKGKSGTCTPQTVNISAVFDHQMGRPYESSDNTKPKQGCAPLPTPPPMWGKIMDFMGEEAANTATADGNYGTCGIYMAIRVIR
jgi:hypothetical protein